MGGGLPGRYKAAMTDNHGPLRSMSMLHAVNDVEASVYVQCICHVALSLSHPAVVCLLER